MCCYVFKSQEYVFFQFVKGVISMVVSSFQIPVINTVKSSHLVSGDSELHLCTSAICEVVGIVKVVAIGMVN